MTNYEKKGGPAFPIVNHEGVRAGGMTLLDWFAGQALIGLLAAAKDDEEKLSIIETVERAFSIADAMLEERNSEFV